MAKLDISQYLQERYYEKLREKTFEGPVVTISREQGCPAKSVARELASRLTELDSKKDKDFPWRWISKEILQEAAKNLGVPESEIKYVFQYEKRTILDDIIKSHSKKYYKSDRAIRKTIARVIHNLGTEGNVIIVGRGGVSICRDIAKSLHLFLTAPLEWRALRLSEKYCISVEEAKKFAQDTDKKRKEFREYFHGKETDYTFFDLSINCMTLSVREIIDMITHTLKLREMI